MSPVPAATFFRSFGPHLAFGVGYFFFGGTFAPFLRASERPIAMACFLLFTRPPFPLLPERKVPRFFRCIALLTLLEAAFPYFGMDFSFRSHAPALCDGAPAIPERRKRIPRARSAFG